jgi:hypothetical protein
MDVVKSHKGIPVRLTKERWFHIVENHDDLAGYYDEVLLTVEEPEYVVEGYKGAFVALREVEAGKFLAVVYREFEDDGFIITAYFTKKINPEREGIIWKKE